MLLLAFTNKERTNFIRKDGCVRTPRSPISITLPSIFQYLPPTLGHCFLNAVLMHISDFPKSVKQAVGQIYYRNVKIYSSAFLVY